MAQAIFKSWFVDFEPWDGVMPEDWREDSLDAYVSFIQGTQVPVENQITELLDGYERFVRIVDFTSTGEAPRYIEIKPSSQRCNESEIVMVRYGNIGLVGRRIAGVYANNLFKIKPKKHLGNNFIYYFFKQNHIQEFIKASSTGSALPAIKHSTIGLISTNIPIGNSVRIFEEICDNMEQIIIKKYNESTNLALLRDTLLPRLMSGELSVADI